jgi:hypothetical protein
MIGASTLVGQENSQCVLRYLLSGSKLLSTQQATTTLASDPRNKLKVSTSTHLNVSYEK